MSPAGITFISLFAKNFLFSLFKSTNKKSTPDVGFSITFESHKEGEKKNEHETWICKHEQWPFHPVEAMLARKKSINCTWIHSKNGVRK